MDSEESFNICQEIKNKNKDILLEKLLDSVFYQKVIFK